MALDPQVVEAARSLARQVVSAGLAQTDPVRQVYFAYVRAGCPGLFGDMLVREGLVDASALARLPDTGGVAVDTQTGRFPRPSESGRMPAYRPMQEEASGMGLLRPEPLELAEDEGKKATRAKPLKRPPKSWDKLAEDGSGLSILEELEAPAAQEAPPPSWANMKGVVEHTQLLEPMPDVEDAPQPLTPEEAAAAFGMSAPRPVSPAEAAAAFGQALPDPRSLEAANQALAGALDSSRSMDELAFDAAAIDALAAQQSKQAAPQPPVGARSMDELAFDAPIVPPVGARSVDELAFDVDATPSTRWRREQVRHASPTGANLDVSEDREREFFSASPSSQSGTGDGGVVTEADLHVGESLGEYDLIEELGRGGMGIVFKAVRQGSVHHYAIKVLKPGEGPLADKRRRRFQREVEIMRQLDHNNLVRIYDCGRQDGFDWYSMDYVEGTELAQLLAEYRLSPDEKLMVFEQVLKAIAHAHERGVVHRDLKPANILVEDELNVRVLDFGLAKIEKEDEDHNLTQAGTALGTPFYMSPEQIRNPTDVGPVADVWSAGVMLYEMMTGRRPFTGQTAGEIANQILNHEPAPLKKINAFVHDDIQAICLRALEKDVSARYQSAEEMLADMQRHRRGKKVKSHGGPVQRARKWLERNRSPFLAGTAVGGLVCVTAVVALVLAGVLRVA